MRILRYLPSALAAISLVAASPALAGSGFATEMSRAVNMDGKSVPQVVIVVTRGQRTLSREALQGAIWQRLSRAGIRPDLIQLQSVATGAMEIAQRQDEGALDYCFEEWCARMVLAD